MWKVLNDDKEKNILTWWICNETKDIKTDRLLVDTENLLESKTTLV